MKSYIMKASIVGQLVTDFSSQNLRFLFLGQKFALSILHSSGLLFNLGRYDPRELGIVK